MRSARDAALAVRRRTRTAVLRRLRSPYPPGARRGPLVHCSHHKAGTVWFNKVLRTTAHHYGLRISVVRAHRSSLTGADISFFEDARLFVPPSNPDVEWRGSHLVRDPRDMAVSGYHYHLRTREPWATTPSADWSGRSYQEHLRRLPPDEGLLVEIERMAGRELRSMAGWDYDHPNVLELRYEDVLADEDTWFERLFRHYGFDDRAVELGLATARRLSLRQLKRPEAASVAGIPAGHIRSGEPGEWRERFTDAHVAVFRELTGDLIERLGYDWS